MTKEELLSIKIDKPDQAVKDLAKAKWDALAKPIDGIKLESMIQCYLPDEKIIYNDQDKADKNEEAVVETELSLISKIDGVDVCRQRYRKRRRIPDRQGSNLRSCCPHGKKEKFRRHHAERLSRTHHDRRYRY